MKNQQTWTKLLVASIGAGCLHAHAVTIDFESLPLDTVVSDQYLADGVVFSSTLLLDEPYVSTFFGHSTTGNVLTHGGGGREYCLEADFTSPMTHVSAVVYAGPGTTVTMRAYDENDTLLGSVVSVGGSYNQGILQLFDIGQISKLSWHPGFIQAALGIDNLSFENVPTTVPGGVPDTSVGLASFGAVLTGVAVLRRKIQRP